MISVAIWLYRLRIVIFQMNYGALDCKTDCLSYHLEPENVLHYD